MLAPQGATMHVCAASRERLVWMVGSAGQGLSTGFW